MKLKVGTIAVLVLLMPLLSGCVHDTPAPTDTALLTAAPTPVTESVTLQYIGHSCFMLTASNGTRIIMDPYNSFQAPMEIAEFPDGLTADYCTISHGHVDHSNINGIGGKPKIFYEPGSYQAASVKVRGYKGDHGLVNNVPTGDNTVFVFEIGNIKIVHMGAEGMISQADIVAAIEGADIITFDADAEARHPVGEMLEQLKKSHAHTIILTHYNFSEKGRYYSAPTIENFLKMLPADQVVVRENGNEIKVIHNMPAQVLVLTPLALMKQK